MNYLSWLTVSTTIILTAAPSFAASQQIIGIDLEHKKQGLELKLELNNNDDSVSSFVTVDGGKTLETTILNTELDLTQKEIFPQPNPAPGIAKITLDRVDKEHTKITLIKDSDLALEPVIEQQGSEIVANFNLEKEDNSLLHKLPFSSNIIDFKNTVASLVTNKNAKDEDKVTNKVTNNTQNNDVLVPNPEIIISNTSDGLNSNLQSENSDDQQYLPRAVAPPVGDMAVSNISTFPDTVNLGSSAVVPRLVLRDAPVREVLSLLARQAGLNIVFATDEEEERGRGDDDENTVEGPVVSLDLENQTVQEVFDSILLIADLTASRRGNIIYIGEKLPAQARNLISRTIRLNQVRAENAALFLATQGAQGQRLTTEVEETVDPETGRVVQRRELPATLEDLGGAAEDEENSTKALLLRGLQVSTDDRMNSITLVGEPRKVEMATAFLTQLDVRRRQVAVNVRVIDVNLLNQDVFNSSFSFGVDDTFFIQDNGAATLRFGNSNPVNTIDGENLRGISLLENPQKFLALLEARITSGNAKILTDPTIVVQEGQESTVKLTQDIIKGVESNISDNGVTTNEPIYDEAGLTVTVNIERIDDNGFVSLSVSPTVSAIASQQEFDSGNAINLISLLSRREVSSGLIRLRDSQTLILSGIIQDQERVAVTKVPILGDIPILGSLFRSTNKTNERAEVIVLLTPEIIDEQADFGYNYQPSKDTREMLREGGLNLPNNPE